MWEHFVTEGYVKMRWIIRNERNQGPQSWSTSTQTRTKTWNFGTGRSRAEGAPRGPSRSFLGGQSTTCISRDLRVYAPFLPKWNHRMMIHCWCQWVSGEGQVSHETPIIGDQSERPLGASNQGTEQGHQPPEVTLGAYASQVAQDCPQGTKRSVCFLISKAFFPMFWSEVQDFPFHSRPVGSCCCTSGHKEVGKTTGCGGGKTG